MMETPIVAPGKASFMSSTMNIMISVLGTGILTVPWALSQSSLVFGVVLLVGICAVNIASFVSLASSCERTGMYSYLGMGTNILGRRAGLFLQSVVLCHTFFSCISYMVFIGAILPDGIRGIGSVDLSDESLRVFCLIGTGLLILPLCLTKNLDVLRYSSGLAVAGIVYTAVCVIYRYMHPFKDDTPAGVSTPSPTPAGEINWTKATVTQLLFAYFLYFKNLT